MGIEQYEELRNYMECDICGSMSEAGFLSDESLIEYCKEQGWKEINGRWICKNCWTSGAKEE